MCRTVVSSGEAAAVIEAQAVSARRPGVAVRAGRSGRVAEAAGGG